MSVPLARRPGAGTRGKKITVSTNHFALQCFPKNLLSHYDVVIEPTPRGNVIDRNTEIVTRLQTHIAPQVFQPRGSFDGRRNLYASTQYSFGNQGVFNVLLTTRQPPPAAPDQGHFRVTLTLVATTRPQSLLDVVKGTGPTSNEALQVLNCLNVIIRQAPMQMYPHNARSFFTQAEKRSLGPGSGLFLCRGYFQSIRPAVGRCLINIDITTGVMWEDGELSALVMDFLGLRDARFLSRLSPADITRLTRQFKGLRIRPSHRPNGASRRIIKFDILGANKMMIPELGQTVDGYFRTTYNLTLQFPSACCVWISRTAALPIELCLVEPNQLYRKKVPSQFMPAVIGYSTKRPAERLQSIVAGLGVMQHENSDYMRQAGLQVGKAPLRVPARVVPGAQLLYGGNRRLDPTNGAWNLRGTQFLRPATLTSWGVAVLEPRSRFDLASAQTFVSQLVAGMQACGLTVMNPHPPIEYIEPHVLQEGLMRLGHLAAQASKSQTLNLIVVITPGAAELYKEVKRWGDIEKGVPTQHVLSDKVRKPSPQYCANVALKCINVKLRGLNHVPARRSELFKKPTIVMGADTSHPGPGEFEKPTISALAWSTDHDASIYSCRTRVQTSRQEIIEDLEELVVEAVQDFGRRNKVAPVQLVFYRDGVSEGQFQEVCVREVEAIRRAFGFLKLAPPAITFVVVGKRHHVRFFPDKQDADTKTGNAPAGLVVDSDIAHPHDWDFYMQSHGGLLGTSRPMHASVIVDDNHMSADQLQELTFALTHNYARATRSVSIPSPVYYADIACGRAGIHFDPLIQWGSDTASVATGGQLTLDFFKNHYRQPHVNIQNTMYFM